jgi:Na+/H+-dicarboxylate symporter
MNENNLSESGKHRLKKFSSGKGKRKRPSILLCIIIAIILGTLTGGWFPDFALNFSIFGEVFLNSLMMLVVPVVMLSLIVGITRLGNIRNLGSVGGRTIAYYLITSGIAVIIGIIIVNIIKPGKGIQPGETHPDFHYTVGGKNSRTVFLSSEKWEKTRYTDKYDIVLIDQAIQGTIESFSDTSVTVKLWESAHAEEQFYIITEDGTQLQFSRIERQLVSSEPELKPSGTGLEIKFSITSKLKGEETGNVGKTLKQILTGDEETGKQGLIPSNIFSAMVNMDILPLIVFALLLGAALSVLGKKANSAINFISTLNDAVMKLVHWIMIVSPIGIFGLITARIGLAGGFKEFLPELISLGKYSMTVMIGLFIHGFIILPLILKVLSKKRPGSYAKGVGAALLNAFSTASSTATLPLTIEGVVEENKVSNKTASFVLPLGATINMDGTALYEAVAAIFIAQVYGIHLEPVMMGVIFLTATLAAIGAAGIPEAGLVTMVIVLKAVGLPIEGIGLLLSIDWMLDRFRTTVNVWGDSVGAAIVDSMEEKKKRVISKT